MKIASKNYFKKKKKTYEYLSIPSYSDVQMITCLSSPPEANLRPSIEYESEITLEPKERKKCIRGRIWLCIQCHDDFLNLSQSVRL